MVLIATAGPVVESKRPTPYSQNIQRTVLTGAEAIAFVEHRKATEPRFHRFWTSGEADRTWAEREASEHLTVVTLRQERRPQARKSFVSRVAELAIGATTLAARGMDDCEEFLLYTALTGVPSHSEAVRVGYLFACEDIEEANYYSDAYELSDDVGVYLGTEMEGPGGYGAFEVEVTLAVTLATDGNGSWWVDMNGPSSVDVQRRYASGTVPNNTYLGIACDQVDTIATAIKVQAAIGGLSAETILGGAIGGAIFCGTTPITVWAVLGCAGVGAVAGVVGNVAYRVGLHMGRFVLDCVFGYDYWSIRDDNARSGSKLRSARAPRSPLHQIAKVGSGNHVDRGGQRAPALKPDDDEIGPRLTSLRQTVRHQSIGYAANPAGPELDPRRSASAGW